MNWASNLEYVTHKENINHALAHRQARYGRRGTRTILNQDDIRNIRSLAGILSLTEIAASFETSASNIIKIIKRTRWKHVV